jgi:two-component system, NtrC family, sensor kinase
MMKQASPDATMRKTILSSMILIPIIPFILVILIGYVYSKASIENKTVESMQRIVEDHRQMIDTFLRERRTNLQFIINTHSFETLNKSWNLEIMYHNLRIISNAFVDLGVFDETGLHVAYYGPYQLEGRIYKDESWFKEVMETGVHISDVFLGFRDYPHFIIAIKKKENGRTWILRATIDTHIFNTMVGRIRIGDTGEAYIINKEGVFQTQPRTGRNLLEPGLIRSAYLRPHTGVKTYTSTRNLGWFLGHPESVQDDYLVATTWLEEKPWLLVAQQEKQDAFSGLRAVMYVIGLIAVIGSAAIIFIAFNQTGRLLQRIRDVSGEKASLENQLIHATRLAELGQMAAGFAHEINNPLQIIRSEQALMDFILTELKEKKEITNEKSLEELEDSVNQMIVQVERCSSITQSILKFGRHAEPQIEDVDLDRFIPEITATVNNKAAVNGITINQVIDEATPPVRADKGQLQQVLLNLFNNAIDAVVDRYGSNGGKLAVYASPAGDAWVDIAVEDNGTGISEDNISKIFSPFFTTKQPGKGTGLGLSVCYGIVEGLGGTMQVSSQVGRGTTFTIRLPAA